MDGRRADTYTEVFYHFVWTTEGRQPMIEATVEGRLHQYVRRKCAELNVTVHALNGMPDHLHLACTVPPVLSVAEFMRLVKGSSAHFINHLEDVQADLQMGLCWQSGYGALTFTKRDLRRIVAYIDNQKIHHEQGHLFPKMECTQAAPRSGGLSE